MRLVTAVPVAILPLSAGSRGSHHPQMTHAERARASLSG